MTRLYVPAYALTLLLSAFLLFSMQPLFGRMILPLLGGSPLVWNTAMLFFQCLLLAGYAYAHAAARAANLRLQAAVQICLLLAACAFLPFAIPAGWTAPPAGADPAFWQLGLMTVAAGAPFFVLSGTAPLLQHWFSRTDHRESRSPYFLYAASNLGSMAALLAYPFAVEPLLDVPGQARAWMYGYFLLIALTVLAAALATARRPDPARREAAALPEGEDEAITWRRRLLWLLLAFAPSSLMLGVTTLITTDLASAPLLWIVPLALYTGTFIIAFARRPVPGRAATLILQGTVLVFVLATGAELIALDRMLTAGIHLALFFLTALMCHHELAALRPSARHLTQFYLVMSLGGALGGAFSALAAPRLFDAPVEYAAVLALSCFLRFAADPAQAPVQEQIRKSLPFVVTTAGFCLAAYVAIDRVPARLVLCGALVFVLTPLLRRRWALGLCALVILAFNPPGHGWSFLFKQDVLYRERNFFGILRVMEKGDGVRHLLHGTTIHGSQATDPALALEKLSYYSVHSGLADAFAAAAPRSVAVLGLGAGTSACFSAPGRHFDFFEIDPAVIKIATDPRYFTYLEQCGSPYAFHEGDARIEIAKQPDGAYDMIVLDVFSSDNIPVHLLTAEAFALYKSKLRPGGLIVAHISNRYLNLRPVVAAAAQTIGMRAADRTAPGGTIENTALKYTKSQYAVLTEDGAALKALEGRGWTALIPEPGFRPWTDGYSNIASVLKILR